MSHIPNEQNDPITKSLECPYYWTLCTRQLVATESMLCVWPVYSVTLRARQLTGFFGLSTGLKGQLINRLRGPLRPVYYLIGVDKLTLTFIFNQAINFSGSLTYKIVDQTRLYVH